MDWSHISAQSALYELWLHLFPLTRPWEFNFLVSPQALFFLLLLHPTLNSFSGLLSSFLISSSPPTFTAQHITSLGITHFTFTFSLTVQNIKNIQVSLLTAEIFSEVELLFWPKLGHLPPLSAVHLLAVVSMDVEWCPNPLKAHVGTVCISFSHLGERPQPFLFTGIPCPLSLQPQPTALA